MRVEVFKRGSEGFVYAIFRTESSCHGSDDRLLQSDRSEVEIGVKLFGSCAAREFKF